MYRIILLLLSSLLLTALATRGAPVEAPGDDPSDERAPLSALEGVLKVHPKFLFRHYLTGFGDGQACALFGKEEELAQIPVGAVVRVKGRLGTRFHKGGTPQNPSPFPSTCFIYMEVESLEVLHDPKLGQDATSPTPAAREPSPGEIETPEPERRPR